MDWTVTQANSWAEPLYARLKVHCMQRSKTVTKHLYRNNVNITKKLLMNIYNIDIILNWNFRESGHDEMPALPCGFPGIVTEIGTGGGLSRSC